jgi:hypothetical protein
MAVKGRVKDIRIAISVRNACQVMPVEQHKSPSGETHPNCQSMSRILISVKNACQEMAVERHSSLSLVIWGEITVNLSVIYRLSIGNPSAIYITSGSKSYLTYLSSTFKLSYNYTQTNYILTINYLYHLYLLSNRCPVEKTPKGQLCKNCIATMQKLHSKGVIQAVLMKERPGRILRSNRRIR